MKLLHATLGLGALAAAAFGQPLVIVGWDGAGKVNVDRLLAEGRLPSLQAFIDGGATYAPMSPNGSTETVSQWAAAFTGLGPAQSGVLAQFDLPSPLSPVFNRNAGIYMDMRWWLAEVPWEHFVFSATGKPLAWFVAKKAVFQDAFGAVAANATIAALHEAGPAGSGCLPADGYLLDVEADALSFMATETEYIVFVHVVPDHYGHHCGESSQEYEDEFIRADAMLGNLRAAAPEAYFLVLADHGFNKDVHPTRFGHPNAPDLWLATNLPIHPDFAAGWPARAEMRDIAPTLMDFYGVPWKGRIPQMRGKSLLSP